MKKIFLVVALGFVSLFAAGCSANKSASSVAQNLVERISSGKYENIEKIIYCEDNSLFSEKNLKELIEEYELNIKGNKTVKVVEESEPKQDGNGRNIVTVTVLIDDNKSFIVDTIEVDGKWYIYEDIFYDTDINIVVPKDVTLLIDGKKIGKDNIEKIPFESKIAHPGDESINVEVKDIEVDMYVFKSPLKGSYKVTLEGDKVLNDVIVTSANCDEISSDNYNYKCTENSIVFYEFNTVELVSNKEIKKFIESYINDVHASLDSKADFSSVKHYYDDEINELAKSQYENAQYWLERASYVEPLDSAYYSNFDLSKLELIDVKYYNDDNIVVVGYYGVDYLYNKKLATGGVDTDDYYNRYKLVLSLKKSGKTYKITNGFSLFWGGE